MLSTTSILYRQWVTRNYPHLSKNLLTYPEGKFCNSSGITIKRRLPSICCALICVSDGTYPLSDFRGYFYSVRWKTCLHYGDPQESEYSKHNNNVIYNKKNSTSNNLSKHTDPSNKPLFLNSYILTKHNNLY
jgi:hypothetical protein